MDVPLEILNAHPRDKRITIVKNGNVRYYLIDGERNHYYSTTERLSFFWSKPFPADEKWGPAGNPFRVEKERLNAETAIFGNFFHLQLEQYENNLTFKPDTHYPQYKQFEDLPNWNKYLQFRETLEPYWKMYRTEWFVFSKQFRLPGTIDAVYRDMRYQDKLVLMVVDYKTSKDPCGFWCDCKGTYDSERQNPDPQSHYPSCSAIGQQPATRDWLSTKCNKDFTQVCIYSKILEDLYSTPEMKIIVSNAIVVYLNAEPVWPLYIHTDDRSRFSSVVEAIIKYTIKKP